MRTRRLRLQILWSFVLCIPLAASFCSLSCSTDYKELVNCSCTAATLPVQVDVICSGEDLNVSSSCDIIPPLSWCSMVVEDLQDVASVGTLCMSTVRLPGSGMFQSSSWSLADVVKPLAPFDVRVKILQNSYNISWSNSNHIEECLIYRVRLRDQGLPEKDSSKFFKVEQKNLQLDKLALCPRGDYIVDVQCQMCLENIYRGPWSEWSTGTTLKLSKACGGPHASHLSVAEPDQVWWYISLPVVLVLLLLLMGLRHKPCWQRKLEVIAYIPKPVEFFKPLYHNYGGNFKEWVKPVFSEYDYLQVTSSLHTLSSKQNISSYSEKDESKPSTHALLPPQQPSENQLFHHQGGESSPSVSLHTVVLSGEDLEEEVLSQSSIVSLVGQQRDQQLSRESSLQLNLQPHAGAQEPERVSLDSFVSNEQSEDSYPHIDLDTIDSGFGESSDSHDREQKGSDLVDNHRSQKSSYVRQWVIGSVTTPE